MTASGWGADDGPPVARETTADLARRVLTAAAGHQRFLLGLCAPPGAGKSTLAAALVAGLVRAGERAVCVPMDGFHLAAAVIAGDDRASRRGAPDTFDPDGFVHLLRRVRDETACTVYAPTFGRDIEDPVAAAIAVDPGHRIVLTEGNYLLLDGPWAPVRGLLDAVWFLDVDDDLRRERLLARHLATGKDRSRAEAFTFGSDECNARLVAGTRARADLAVRWLG